MDILVIFAALAIFVAFGVANYRGTLKSAASLVEDLKRSPQP